MIVDINKIDLILQEELKALPDQAPLEHFVHHNNLHYYEEEKFEKAVEHAFFNFGRSPYMNLTYYRKKLAENEINEVFFIKRLKENGFDLHDSNLINYIKLHLHSFRDVNELKFLRGEELIYDSDFKNLISIDERGKKLWNQIDHLDCSFDETNYPDFHVNRSLGRINKILVPFLASLLDQGQAYVQLNDAQRQNFWSFFSDHLKTVLSKEQFKTFLDNHANIGQSSSYLFNLLAKNCNSEDELRSKIRNHLHSLPGWAGIINKVGHNKEIIPRKNVYLDIYDYLLMRIILQDVYQVKQKTTYVPITSIHQIKENVFYSLYYFTPNLSAEELLKLFNNLNPLVLRRIYQQSYEDTYQNLIMTGIAKRGECKSKIPKYQMFFCLDDREESFRRHLEEVSPAIETFGVAGFFGLDMYYQKINEPRPRRHCPPAATPQYLVKEEGVAKNFKFAHLLHDSNQNFIKSTLFNFIYAPFRGLEFKWHLFFPRSKRVFSNFLRMSKIKKIHYYRSSEEQSANKLKHGFTKLEASERVAGILKGAGLVQNFARYILMIGHGHDSFNNPHVSAYRCGACSGSNAFPNARIFAEIANEAEIRNLLKINHNIVIPDDCYFVGGYHDTCNDNVELYGIDNNKFSKIELLELQGLLLKARQSNAQERCLRFYQERKELTPEDALKIVEARAWRVAEPRPELNHANNALCIVGKRELTKGLFLDRKAFLVSYDSAIDKDNNILAGLLKAAIPVCAGINLEYYFSKVDTENYGSGSKTSHNVTGLFGVMNGVRGDLRTGLVWQMVEYHEPLRILFIIEASEVSIRNIMATNQEVNNLIKNNWILLSIIDPQDSSKIKIYKDDIFQDFSPLDIEFEYFKNSSEIKTGLSKPVHFAYLGDNTHG